MKKANLANYNVVNAFNGLTENIATSLIILPPVSPHSGPHCVAHGLKPGPFQY